MKKLIDDEITVTCYDNPFLSIPRQEYEYDRRTQPRIEFAAQVLIASEHKVIRTWTLDVSVTGLSLKQELPTSFLNRKLEVTLLIPLDDEWKRLRFQAVMIGSYVPSCRLMYVGGQEEEILELHRFIQLLKSA